MELIQICNMIFRKWGVGGSKADWNFSKNSSIFVWPSVPKPVTEACWCENHLLFPLSQPQKCKIRNPPHPKTPNLIVPVVRRSRSDCSVVSSGYALWCIYVICKVHNSDAGVCGLQSLETWISLWLAPLSLLSELPPRAFLMICGMIRNGLCRNNHQDVTAWQSPRASFSPPLLRCQSVGLCWKNTKKNNQKYK